MNELSNILDHQGGSPQPSPAEIKLFRKMVDRLTNEMGTTIHLLPKVLPIIDDILLSDTECTVSSQAWASQVLLRPELKPPLKVPKPDQTFGWRKKSFPFEKAKRSLRFVIDPIAQAPQLLFPYCTVEVKGELGSRRVCRLQNLYNGLIMLNNLLKLKQAIGKEDEFLGKIQVISVELTLETLAISCYWT